MIFSCLVVDYYTINENFFGVIPTKQRIFYHLSHPSEHKKTGKMIWSKVYNCTSKNRKIMISSEIEHSRIIHHSFKSYNFENLENSKSCREDISTIFPILPGIIFNGCTKCRFVWYKICLCSMIFSYDRIHITRYALKNINDPGKLPWQGHFSVYSRCTRNCYWCKAVQIASTRIAHMAILRLQHT